MSFRRKPWKNGILRGFSTTFHLHLACYSWRIPDTTHPEDPWKQWKKSSVKNHLGKVKPQRGLVCLGLAHQQSPHDHFYTEHSWMEITITAYDTHVKWCLESLKVLFYTTWCVAQAVESLWIWLDQNNEDKPTNIFGAFQLLVILIMKTPRPTGPPIWCIWWMWCSSPIKASSDPSRAETSGACKASWHSLLPQMFFPPCDLVMERQNLNNLSFWLQFFLPVKVAIWVWDLPVFLWIKVALRWYRLRPFFWSSKNIPLIWKSEFERSAAFNSTD